jgi:hypothetical protein
MVEAAIEQRGPAWTVRATAEEIVSVGAPAAQTA